MATMSVRTGDLTIKTVKRLKGAGFWRTETESELVKVVGLLMLGGSTEAEACGCVERMWEIVKGEYGE